MYDYFISISTFYDHELNVNMSASIVSVLMQLLTDFSNASSLSCYSFPLCHWQRRYIGLHPKPLLTQNQLILLFTQIYLKMNNSVSLSLLIIERTVGTSHNHTDKHTPWPTDTAWSEAGSYIHCSSPLGAWTSTQTLANQRPQLQLRLQLARAQPTRNGINTDLQQHSWKSMYEAGGPHNT
jgi:hypothetical protein